MRRLESQHNLWRAHYGCQVLKHHDPDPLLISASTDFGISFMDADQLMDALWN